MPGRWFIGLSAGEKHPSEFQPSRLPDEPEITFWLVLGAVVAALAVIALGYVIDHPIPPSSCDWFTKNPGVRCPEPKRWGSDIPMTVWFSLSALVATLVLVTPFLAYQFKRRTGRI
jgi:hypothetical protein